MKKLLCAQQVLRAQMEGKGFYFTSDGMQSIH